MSTTTVVYPIVAAVKAAESILGPDRQWQPVNATQARFLAEFFATGRAEVDRISEIESCVSFSCDEVNAFLRKRGFTVQLEPWTAPGDFGMASVLDLLCEWVKKGKTAPLQAAEGGWFPGVRIGSEGVRFFTAAGHANPIAALATKSGDAVYLSMSENAPDGFDLVAAVQALSRTKQPNDEFGGLLFPMVALEQEVNIAWLIGLGTVGEDRGPARIAQALQQTRLKLNEVGIRLQSAAAAQTTRSFGKTSSRDHVINRPFLIWFEREGLSQPLFAGHITLDDWRDPGDVSQG